MDNAISNKDLESRDQHGSGPNGCSVLAGADVRASKTGLEEEAQHLITNFDGIDWI